MIASSVSGQLLQSVPKREREREKERVCLSRRCWLCALVFRENGSSVSSFQCGTSCLRSLDSLPAMAAAAGSGSTTCTVVRRQEGEVDAVERVGEWMGELLFTSPTSSKMWLMQIWRWAENGSESFCVSLEYLTPGTRRSNPEFSQTSASPVRLPAKSDTSHVNYNIFPLKIDASWLLDELHLFFPGPRLFYLLFFLATCFHQQPLYLQHFLIFVGIAKVTNVQFFVFFFWGGGGGGHINWPSTSADTELFLSFEFFKFMCCAYVSVKTATLCPSDFWPCFVSFVIRNSSQNLEDWRVCE